MEFASEERATAKKRSIKPRSSISFTQTESQSLKLSNKKLQKVSK